MQHSLPQCLVHKALNTCLLNEEYSCNYCLCASPGGQWKRGVGNNEIKVFSAAPIPSVQFSSVTQLCLTLCDPMNRSTPGFPVRHQLLEFTQSHIHRVSDAIQPSHPLSSPSPPAPNPSQHQSLFQ